MKLYSEFAELWPMFCSPEEYRKETNLLVRLLKKSCDPPPRTVLELGSGGGNSASHLKAHFEMTLVDLSPQMLALSRALNPECEHVEGDIRTVQLGRSFDAVFVHDAICHMTNVADLGAAMKTAFEHCRPGGVALFVPDDVRESFVPRTDHGGSDSGRGGVRFVQWITDPDPADTEILVDFGILVRDDNGAMRVVHERHIYGLFARSVWLTQLRKVGFQPRAVRSAQMREVFLARRPR
ncbi:MAG: class I SAM-dependent methyltransferase [Candidatus Dormibacterales bacterium]